MKPNQTIHSTRRKRGFTLVELLVTITIIGILAAITVGGLNFVSEKQANEKAKVQIGLLSNGIEEYKLDNGDYPGPAQVTPVVTATGNGQSNILFRALFWDPSVATPAGKIYTAALDPKSTKQGWLEGTTQSAKIVDPWGYEYLYRKGDKARNPDFDLWSRGADGRTVADNTAAAINHKDSKDDVWN